MVELNGYKYSHDEVVEALMQKGYNIICDEYEVDKRGDKKVEWHAVKENEKVSVLNKLSSIAIKEFHKKPPLV